MNEHTSDAETTSLRCVLCSEAQWRLTLCSPMDCSLPGSSIRGGFQARILECVAISYSRGSSWLRDRTRVSCISCFGKQILYHYHQSFPLIWGPSFYLQAENEKTWQAQERQPRILKLEVSYDLSMMKLTEDKAYAFTQCSNYILVPHPQRPTDKSRNFKPSLESP